MKHVFLAFPNLYGHRQIYCRQFCDYFLTRGLTVTVAARLEGLGEYQELLSLVEDPRVTFISDTWRFEKGPVRKLRGLVAAAYEAHADVTFLAEADECRGMLTAQITHPSLRLPGRRVGLFIGSTSYIHQAKQSGRRRLFHEVVAQHLPVLEKALALDEAFVAREGGRYIWLPDIAVWPGATQDGQDEAGEWQGRMAEFLAAQGGKPVVVYVGMPQERRNYARLLELARDIDGCFIHCGALHDTGGYPQEKLPARRELAERSALLEFGRFYQDFETAKSTLAAAQCVVLPYDAGHLTSSGAMLQTLMAGRPVLVPDSGLMAIRVRTFGLGQTYRPDDRQDMRQKFLAMDSTPPADSAERADRFLDFFSREQFEAAMDAALGFDSTGPRLPS